MRVARVSAWVTLGLLAVLGCGGKSAMDARPDQDAEGQVAAARERAPLPEALAAAPAAAARKIIYNHTLELLVADFETARQELARLVEVHGGYVASSEVGGSPGSPRAGQWVVRVPVAKSAAFVEAAVRLGEPTRQQSDAQDVTDEFTDLEARLKNKRVEEERLVEHLKTSTGKLEDILAIERELARVRGEIEQTQGRLQKLG